MEPEITLQSLLEITLQSLLESVSIPSADEIVALYNLWGETLQESPNLEEYLTYQGLVQKRSESVMADIAKSTMAHVQAQITGGSQRIVSIKPRDPREIIFSGVAGAAVTGFQLGLLVAAYQQKKKKNAGEETEEVAG